MPQLSAISPTSHSVGPSRSAEGRASCRASVAVSDGSLVGGSSPRALGGAFARDVKKSRFGEEGVRRAAHAARTEEQVAAHVRRRPARRRAAAAAAAAASGTGRCDWVGPTWYGHR